MPDEGGSASEDDSETWAGIATGSEMPPFSLAGSATDASTDPDAAVVAVEDSADLEAAEPEGTNAEDADLPAVDLTNADFEEPELGMWEAFDQDLDGMEDWDEGLVPVLVPEIMVAWPQPYAPAFLAVLEPGDQDSIELAQLIPELPALWRILADAVHRVGFGCLTHESVRWGSGGWQLIPMPRYSFTGAILSPDDHDAAVRKAAWLQDRHVIAYSLVRAVTGRWPIAPADALALIDSAAGDVALGLDAVVDTLLHGSLDPGDVQPLQDLHCVLSRTGRNPMEFRSFRETMVGSGKASGSVEDNEDLAWSMSTGTAQTCLALMDGITGEHDGSGRRAVLAAMAAVRSAWESGKLEPASTIAVADAEVCARTSNGGATAVFAHLLRDGRGQLASVGDSAAWLIRPDDPVRPTRYQAWRLTPVHTEYAESLREDPTATRGRSALTRHLGGAAHRPFTLRFGLVPGDLLALVSDGAAVEEKPGQWFGTVLSELASGRMRAGRAVGPGLAADLVIRAELLGGLDNATALVVETDWAATDEETPIERNDERR